MKTYVITLSKRFPTGHNRAGEPTHFWEKFIKGRDNYSCIYRDFWETTIPKIHTIRANYPLWKKRIVDDMLCQHTGKGTLAKHIVSLYDMCFAEETVYPMDTWDEKITDSLNYLFLLKAIVKEGHTN